MAGILRAKAIHLARHTTAAYSETGITITPPAGKVWWFKGLRYAVLVQQNAGSGAYVKIGYLIGVGTLSVITVSDSTGGKEGGESVGAAAFSSAAPLRVEWASTGGQDLSFAIHCVGVEADSTAY